MTAGAIASRDEATSPHPLWKHPAFRWTLVVSAIVVLSMPVWEGALQSELLDFESLLAGSFGAGDTGGLALLLIPAAGLGAGIVASLSPCILPLIPLNLAYIGASEVGGRRAAWISGRFVLGAAIALTALGVFADLAGFLLIDHRGPLLLGAGIAMLYFGMVVLEVAPGPFRGRAPMGARRLGPVGAGAAFSLVTTPCSSPLLAAVLAAAAAQAVAGLAVVTMLCFSVGYTTLVFLSGVFGGRLVGRVRRSDFAASRAAAGALLLSAGVTFALSGSAWF